MVALTSLALAAGAASMAYGAYESYTGQQKAQEGYQQAQQGAQIQAQAAQQQAQISKEQAAASVGFAAQDRDLNISASDQSIAAAQQSNVLNKQQIVEQQNIEATQKQAMELDARRQQLQVIRDQQRGRALALTNANAQGASKGSGLQGGYGQVSGQSGVNLLGIQQNLGLGESIFASNAAISNSRIQLGDLETNYAIQQAQNQTAKSNLTYAYAQSNAAFQTRQADTQTLMAQGGGQVAAGQGFASMGNSQAAFGNSLFSAGPGLFNMGMNANQLSGTSLTSLLGGYKAPVYGMYS